MRSWNALVLLAVTYYGVPYLPWDYRWHAFTAMLGLISCLLFWNMRGPRWSVMWAVCLWGTIEGAEVFVCQLLGAYTRAVTVRQFEGMCDVQTGFPFFTFGLLMMTVCATLWIERHGWTTRR